MKPESIDDYAGIPLMAPPKKATTDSTVCSIAGNDAVGRNQADEPIPLGCLTVTVPVTPEVQARRDADRSKAEQERQWRESLTGESDRNRSGASRVIRKVTISLVLVFAGLGAILLWTQLIQAIGMIGSWPFWPRVSAFATLATISILVVASITRLIWFAAKFRRNRPATRMLLEQREGMRTAAQRLAAGAKKQLGQYIENYPLDDASHEAFLRRWGVPDDDFVAMKRNRNGLLDVGNRQDSVTWQRTFEACYLGPLDRAADQIIREYAVLVALKTAICPYALLDMCVVVYMGSAMLGSLCRVYQLRTGPLDMIYLFGLIMGQAFFADRVEEHSDEMTTWLDGSASGLLEHVGLAVPDLAANMLSKLAAKGSQGLANGLLLNRIGRQACRMLRPLNLEK